MTCGTLSWAERHITLFGSPFKRADYPQAEEPAEFIDRDRGKIFILRFPPQVFKTLLMQLILAHAVDTDPQQILWYAVTGRDADDFSDEKLSGLLKQPRVWRHMPAAVDDQGSKRLFKFIGSPVSLLSQDVKSHRNSRSASMIFMDEAWQYGPGHVAEIIRRSDSYERTRRIIIGETAPEEGAETVALYDQSSQRVWHFACPLCQQAVPCEHGTEDDDWGLRWDRTPETRGEDGIWFPALAAETAHWVCPACKGRVNYSHATLAQMNDRSRGAGYVQTNPKADPKIEAWRATGIVFRDWREVVKIHLNAVNALRRGVEREMKEYVMKSAMRVWRPMAIHNDKIEYPYGGYMLGDEWADEAVSDIGRHRIITVDVQQTHLWALCRQYGKGGRSRLLAFQKLLDEHELEAFRESLGVPADRVFVDAGYDPKTNKSELGGRVSQMAARRVYWLLNGIDRNDFMHGDGKMRIYSEPKPYDAFRGTEQQGQYDEVILWQYGSIASKSCLRLMREQRDEITGERLWTIPDNASEEYKKQAWAERFKKIFEGNTEVWKWVKANRDNHAFDLECMQYVASRILKLAESLEIPQTSSTDGVRESA